MSIFQNQLKPYKNIKDWLRPRASHSFDLEMLTLHFKHVLRVSGSRVSTLRISREVSCVHTGGSQVEH